MFSNIKTKFKEKPTLFYALSICATWAGIGSLMNGVTMTQTYGIIPSIIWVLGNTIACIVFGLVAMKLPKVREVFGSSIMKWICGASDQQHREKDDGRASDRACCRSEHGTSTGDAAHGS